jgi:hypothetical protein
MPARPPAPHPNGVVGVDHVVVATDVLSRTTAALEAVGARVRRVREGGGLRQAFLWLGDVILEVVESPRAAPGAARLWGVTLVCADLDATVAGLGDRCGAVRPAVQPGRRIAALRREAGLGLRVALMTPHGPGSNPARGARDSAGLDAAAEAR